MVDYRVRFVGDLGNLKQFDAAVQHAMGSSAKALEEANLKVARSAGVGTFGGLLTKDAEAGRFATNIKTQIDSVNRTFIQSGEIVRRYLSGYKEITDELGNVRIEPVFSDEYISNFRKVTGNYDTYLRALDDIQRTEVEIGKLRDAENRRLEQSLTKQNQLAASIAGTRAAAGKIQSESIINNPVDRNIGRTYKDVITQLKGQLAAVESGALFDIDRLKPSRAAQAIYGLRVPQNINGLQYTSDIQREIDFRNRQIKEGRGTNGLALSPGQIQDLRQEAAFLESTLKNVPVHLNSTAAQLNAALTNYENTLHQSTEHLRVEIAAYEQQIAKLQVTDAQGALALQRRVDTLKASNPAYAALAGATEQTPPINANLQRALNQSQQLRKQLIQEGLGGGARYSLDANSDFAKNLALQEAAVTKFTRNLRTGVTTIEGSARQLNAATGELGVVEKFTADIDKNGKVITRWGGQLSGAGSVLRQTVRDFQKVIEWTIATTAVFGTLGLAISSLKTINDLNTSLTRFSITAQVSVGEAKQIFNDLGQVAIDTATPLSDLVKVADDIALATKTAGDSTDEWKAKIIDLTTAVGIFTNLTGEDTVQGADKLSSAFKQLSIAPRDLITVLNQVTAVAGGQSTAINDIVTALGGVGEAGKAAQLSVKEQIALVQVLGQVTNKSAADTATAFKNLFGSISSPGSEKILKEFGINVRDTVTGGLRPFLTIYREINKALEDGTIPLTRYQDVLRGISGGPRRAPDAAALLGNLPAVEAAIARASGATNEALVANAKILDTNAAKIQQLQNAFDIALFQKFGQIVTDATAAVSGFLTVLLEGFNSLDPAVLALVLQFGAMLVAGKALAALFGRIGPAGVLQFGNISKAIKAAAADFVLFGQSAYIQTQLNYGKLPQTVHGPIVPTARTVLAGALSTTAIKAASSSVLDYIKNLGALRSSLLLVGATAALTIGQHAASGGLNVDPQTIGTFLQLAGAVSVSTGVFAPLGVAALAAGTALQFLGGQTEDAARSAHDSSVAVYDAIQKLKEARVTADEAAKAQSTARAKLNQALDLGSKDVATKEAQTAATKEFVTATLNLADANQLVSESYDDLLAKIPGLGEGYRQFKDLAKNGFIPPDQIQALVEQLAAEILKVQNLGSLVPGPVEGPIKVPPAVQAPQTFTGQDLTRGETPFDEKYLTPEGLKELFDVNIGGRTNVQLPVSQQNIAKITTSLQDIISGKAEIGLKPDQIDRLTKAIYDWIGSVDTVAALQTKAASDQALIQARGTVGALSGDQLTNAQGRADLVSALAAASRGADLGPITDRESLRALQGTGAKTSGVSLDEVRKLINQISAGESGGLGLDVDELTKAGTVLLAMKGTLGDIASLGPQALKEGIAQQLVAVGINAEEVERIFGIIPGTLEKTADELDAIQEKAQKFTDATANALTKFANRSAQLVQQQNSGDFDKNAAGLEALQKQNQAAYDSEVALINSIKELSDPALTELQTQLSGVVGLQNATVLSGDELSAALIDQAIAAGVNAKGIRKIQDEVIKLINLSNILSRIRTTYNIKVNVDAAGALKILKALLSAQLAFGASHHGPGGAYFQGQSIPGLQNAINELQAAISAANSAQNTINTVIAGGRGTNFGQPASTGGSRASRARAGLDVSNLDLPEEIANASNRDALIKLAIANARALQSKIPGASKDAKNDVVELLKGTQRILEVRGVKDDYLRKALEELADVEKKRLDFETKADTIRRIRIGSGSFAAIANLPVNSKTGVSLGGPQGPINITLNLNGTVLTPAQLAQFADLVAASLKKQIANG